MSHKPESVVYVGTSGELLPARTLGSPGPNGKTRLLVAYGGGKGMGVIEAAQSGGKGLGTWHHPDQPS